MTSYLLVTMLLWPLVVLYTAKLAWRYRSLRYFKQRLGYALPKTAAAPVWIHCASVGEVNTVRVLLESLIKNFPAQKFIVTTNTVTGARVVKKCAFKNTRHCYLPVDTYGTVKRFLAVVQPRLAIIMETELWPLLYQQCHRQHVTLCIINGRLSSRTLDSHGWIKARYRDALGQVDQVLCRSEADRQAFIQLGMAAEKTATLGNLKFAQAIASVPENIVELEHKHYVLAASTHHDEEYRISKIWAAIDSPGKLLVIAPRHPERAPAIIEQLQQLKLNVARRSCGDRISDATDIYLADTIGELRAFIHGADLVIMGGSLIPRGGQNLLEPASLGKAIIVGPHMDNFAMETALLLEQQACIQVTSEQQLATALVALLHNTDKQKQLGEQARQAVTAQAQVAEIYLQKISHDYARLLVS